MDIRISTDIRGWIWPKIETDISGYGFEKLCPCVPLVEDMNFKSQIFYIPKFWGIPNSAWYRRAMDPPVSHRVSSNSENFWNWYFIGLLVIFRSNNISSSNSDFLLMRTLELFILTDRTETDKLVQHFNCKQCSRHIQKLDNKKVYLCSVDFKVSKFYVCEAFLVYARIRSRSALFWEKIDTENISWNIEHQKRRYQNSSSQQKKSQDSSGQSKKKTKIRLNQDSSSPIFCLVSQKNQVASSMILRKDVEIKRRMWKVKRYGAIILDEFWSRRMLGQRQKPMFGPTLSYTSKMPLWAIFSSWCTISTK